MPVSGGWMARNAAVSPMYEQWTVVDARHTRDDIPVDQRRADNIIDAGPYQPTGVTDVQGDLEPTGDTSQRIDRTPVVHHGTPMHAGMTPAELAAVHSAELGADLAQTTTPWARFPLDGDRWNVELQADMDAPPAARGATDRPDLIRGLNAYAANNPPHEMYQGAGWRQGARWQKVWTDHNLALPQRYHRFRVLRVLVGQSDSDTPPPGDTVYSAAWSSLARTIRNNFAQPRMRRVPGPIDEAVMVDGTDELAGADVGDFI